MADNYREYSFGERPDVEVLVEGIWYPCELRAWSRPFPSAGGVWWGHVAYRTGTARHRFATVHSDRIRKAEPPVGAWR